MNFLYVSTLGEQRAASARPFQALITVFVLLVSFTTPCQANGGISEASFQGRYAGAIRGFGGTRPVMIIGVLTFNGDGTGSADTVWNLPGTGFTERKVLPTTFEFSYTVDENGFGILKAQSFADIHFIATRSKRLPGRNNMRLALEIRAMTARFEIDGGNLLIGFSKRLPNQAEFNAQALKGRYGGFGVGSGGRLLSLLGYVELNGDGTGNEFSLWNLPNPTNTHQRELTFIPTTVRYSINPNGIGVSTVLLADGVEVDSWFVVTETRRRRGIYIAEEILAIQNELDPLTGDFVYGSVKRLSN